MSQNNENIRKISKGISSKWRQSTEYRIKNKWLNYSSQIARRVLSAIDENKDMTQSKLASSLNVSPQQISKIVKGKENLTLETIYKLSQALNVELISFPSYKWNERKGIQATIGMGNYIVILINANSSQGLITDVGIKYDIAEINSAMFHYNQITNSYPNIYGQ